MDAADYQEIFYRLLPRGRLVWPERSGEMPGWDALAAAISHAPAEVDARAADLVTESIPAETVELLPEWLVLVGLPEEDQAEDWATYTDDQKRQALVAKLRRRSDPNLPNMQLVYEALFANTEVILRHKTQPPFRVGENGASYPVGDAWQAVWTLEYMTNLLTIEPDDFESWIVGVNAAVTNEQAQSPLTLGPTAALVVLPTLVSLSDDTIQIEPDYNNNEDMFFVFYVRAESVDALLNVQAFGRDGAPIISETFLTGAAWARFEIRGNVGAGVDSVLVVLASPAGASYYLSYAVCGARQITLETRAKLLAPINTQGVFDVISALPRVIDDFDSAILIDDDDGTELTA